jgi:hypothetical protein
MDINMKAAWEFLQKVTSNAKYIFRLYGYARSGQHAISNWLVSQAPQPSLWINNIQEFEEDVDFQHYWYGPVKPFEPNLVGLGFEGKLIDHFYKFPNYFTIIVIRDIFNQTASLAKHPDLKVNDSFFKNWEINAEQALEGINLVKNNHIIVLFNRWCESTDYRKRLFNKVKKELGFPYEFTDAGFNSVKGIGGGSSFDGMSYADNASQMKVLERYKDPAVQGALKLIPGRLLELNSALFD